jgi:hypothetical protein
MKFTPKTYSTGLITPEIAKALLERVKNNRPLKEPNIARLVQAMKSGAFKFNGDAIRISKAGYVMDGQHRLHAIIRSGITCECLFVNSLDQDVFATMDIGAKRTASDTLAVEGEVNTRNLAAALAMVESYMRGNTASGKNYYSNCEIRTLLDKYPDLRASIPLAIKAKKLICPAVLVSCHYICSRLDADTAGEMIKALLHGRNLNENDPIYVLRERLIENMHAKAKLSSWYVFALVIKAWNAKRTGKVLRRLVYQDAEEFPQAQ